MPSSSSLPSSIPDTQLGLSAPEIHILRQHQQIALATSSQHGHQSSHSSYSAVNSTRGRGYARSTTASSSRASSNATSGSHQNGRLMLDAGSLTVLGQHFERLMGAIQQRVEYLSAQTTLSTNATSLSAASSLASADAEIARFRNVLQQIDELETEFDKVRHIRDIVKSFRGRVEGLERRVDGRRRR
ncbi:hypothetical protein MMC06_004478 [Schaereria dolodes]|nr:hypothetical protein [Schaereria dolodes]